MEGQFSTGWGTVVAYNRRSVYANGSAAMYGKQTARTSGASRGGRPTSIRCSSGTRPTAPGDDRQRFLPPREVEGLSELHADYWHPTRQMLHGKFGEDVCIVALCGARGHVPATQYRKAAREPHVLLAGNSPGSRKSAGGSPGVEESYEPAKTAKTSDVLLKHEYAVISLPQYRITEAEYKQTKSEAESLKKAMETDPNKVRLYDWPIRWSPAMKRSKRIHTPRLAFRST